MESCCMVDVDREPWQLLGSMPVSANMWWTGDIFELKTPHMGLWPQTGSGQSSQENLKNNFITLHHLVSAQMRIQIDVDPYVMPSKLLIIPSVQLLHLNPAPGRRDSQYTNSIHNKGAFTKVTHLLSVSQLVSLNKHSGLWGIINKYFMKFWQTKWRNVATDASLMLMYSS